MKIVIDKELCTGCGLCVDSCAMEAIKVVKCARIDSVRCVNCKICIIACPVNAIVLK